MPLTCLVKLLRVMMLTASFEFEKDSYKRKQSSNNVCAPLDSSVDLQSTHEDLALYQPACSDTGHFGS